MYALCSIGSCIAKSVRGGTHSRSDGSLLLAMLMHTAVNQTIGIVPTRVATPGNPFALDTSLVTLLAGGIFLVSVAYFFVQLRHIDDRSREAPPPDCGLSLASHERLSDRDAPVSRVPPHRPPSLSVRMV